MIKTIAFIVLLVHGIGHLQGVVINTGINAKGNWNTSSWLFGNMLGAETTRYVCLGLHLITAIIGIATALSFKDLIISSTFWQTLALITAILSTIGLIIFPNAFAQSFNKIGAIAVNLIIYYSILFGAQWPSEVFNN
jgi:hypothetical protein